MSTPDASSWDACEKLLLEFEAAWRDPKEPPDLAGFIGRAAPEDRSYVTVELIAIDLEHSWKRGQGCRAEGYLGHCPRDADQRNFRDEVFRREAEVRADAGHLPGKQELESRFVNDLRSYRRLFSNEGESDSQSGVATVSGPLQPGDVFGHYTIEKEIGAGAFSRVYAASDGRLNRRVAIKVLKVVLASEENRQRMIREAQAVATINHPNVVPVFEIGQESGRDFIVSRLIEGPTLQAKLADSHFEPSEAAELIAQLAGALSTAHSLGIVHRDIKPANILMEGDTPLLVDFGLAHLSEASANLTGEGDIIGTPAYMSPEQAGGHGWQADPRSDIYSLGAVLYQLLCGRRTFSGSAVEVLSRVVHSEPEHPSRVKPGLDKDLVTVCLKSLEKAPEDRYPTARLFEQDLRRYLNGETIHARRAGVSTRVWKWAKRKPTLATMCAATLCLMTFLGGTLIQLDRARRAENETKGLLAVSAAKAGELAMQRGRMAEAIGHFDEALKLGNTEPAALKLSQVEALVALRQLDKAVSVLRSIDADASVEETRGSLILWQAELALEGYDEFGTALQLFEQALGTGHLSPEDAEYVGGMLAETSPDALSRFLATLQRDPFHHRARRMALVLLISLARLDEAGREVHTALEVFPEDTDFMLMQTLVLAMQGDLATAKRKLDDVAVEDTFRQSWEKFLAGIALVAEVSGPVPNYSVGLIGGESGASRLEIVQSRGWHLPLRVAEAFDGFAELLANANSGVNLEVRERLGRIVEVHPEGSLTVVLGEQFTAGAPDSVADAERARDLFLAAMDRPMAIRASQDYANRGVFGTTVYLALVARKDVPENQRLYLEAARRMNPQREQKVETVRILTIASLIAGDLDLAETWARRWVAAAPDNPDAVWHRAIVHSRRQEHLSVVKVLDRFLKLSPGHEAAISMRNGAREKIRQSLDPDEQGARIDAERPSKD